jgi:single-strand DNA-binding protein
MINRVILVGRLTRDPEARVTTGGKNVVDFSIAVNKRVKSGESDADFFRIVAWEKTAEYVSNYLGKGRLVAVDGRLQSRKYTASDGSNREVVEVVADTVQSLDRPRDDAGGAAPTAAVAATGGAVPAEDEFDPFADE